MSETSDFPDELRRLLAIRSADYEEACARFKSYQWYDQAPDAPIRFSRPVPQYVLDAQAALHATLVGLRIPVDEWPPSVRRVEGVPMGYVDRDGKSWDHEPA